MTSDAELFERDPRRLQPLEYERLYWRRVREEITPADLARLRGHEDARDDDACRRNIIHKLRPEHRAWLADPVNAPDAAEYCLQLRHLVNWRKRQRTKIGERVHALIVSDEAIRVAS